MRKGTASFFVLTRARPALLRPLSVDGDIQIEVPEGFSVATDPFKYCGHAALMQENGGQSG
jgi:hypothetical protein